MANPKVSVVITYYNQANYIEKTVKSVLTQTYGDFEIVIVNDGSTNANSEILKTFDWKNTKIIHIENGGVSRARNVGIAASNGQYILPLDGDDLIGPEYIRKAVDVLDNNVNVKVVTCDTRYFGRASGKFNLPEYSLDELMGHNLLVVSSMFRKEDFHLCPGFNENMRDGFEDWDFWISFLKDGGEVFKIREPLFFYRISNKSRNSTISPESMIKLRRQIYLNHPDLFQTKFLDPLVTFEYLILLHSKEYRVGKMLLSPVRKILKALNI